MNYKIKINAVEELIVFIENIINESIEISDEIFDKNKLHKESELNEELSELSDSNAIEDNYNLNNKEKK